MPRIALFAVLAAWLFCLSPVPVAHAERTVTIATYNVENFFDIYDDPYTEDEGTEPKSRTNVQQLARAIKAIDADVIALQEVENAYVLQAMCDEFLPTSGYNYVATLPGNDGRGINLGVISKLPITEMHSYRFQTFSHPERPNERYHFSRDVLRVDLETGGEPVSLFVVHLKSNRSSPGDENSSFKRTAEAMQVKKIVREAVAKNPEMLAVVLGDFNSNYETRPEQPRPWPAMEHLLAPESDGSQLLTDVHATLGDEQRVTIPGDGRYPPATFDYILATPAMAEAWVKGSSKVLQDKGITQGSDHRPVLAKFRVP